MDLIGNLSVQSINPNNMDKIIPNGVTATVYNANDLSLV